jgi:hypothetical protein
VKTQTHCVESSRPVLAWSSLIIGRTRSNQSLAVFADSLPNYSRNSFRDLQEILQHTPLLSNVTWYFKPSARGGTNDCGYARTLSNALHAWLIEVRIAVNRRWIEIVSLHQHIKMWSSDCLLQWTPLRLAQRLGTHEACLHLYWQCILSQPFFTVRRDAPVISCRTDKSCVFVP